MVNFWKQSMYATKLRRFRLYGVPGRYYTKLGSVNRTSFAVCFMNCLLQALPFINWAYSGFRCMFWPLFKQCVLSKNVSLLHWRLYLPSAFFLSTLSAPFQWYFVLNVSAGSHLRCKRGPIPRTSVCMTVPTCQLLTTEFWAVCSWDGLTKVYWRWWHESMQQEIINKWTIYIKLKIKKSIDSLHSNYYCPPINGECSVEA